MLKVNLSEYKKNVFDEIGKKGAILTVGDYDNYNAMTVSWGGFGVLWNMNVCFVFVRPQRYTYKFAEESENFTLSFMSSMYKDAVNFFGTYSGRDVNKFEKCNLHPCYDPDYKGYFVAEADYVFRLKKLCKIPFELIKDQVKDYYPKEDYHTIYVCKIVDLLKNEDYNI